MASTASTAFAALSAEAEPSSLLTRGLWEAPSWAVATLGTLVVVSGAIYLARRGRGARGSEGTR